MKPGDQAPDFSVATLENQPLKLSDFRGKFVLLDFWATWCGPCIAEMPDLKATCDAFGGDKRFAIVRLSADSDREAPKKFLATRDIHWTQAFAGDSTDGVVARNYVLSTIPKIFLARVTFEARRSSKRLLRRWPEKALTISSASDRKSKIRVSF